MKTRSGAVISRNAWKFGRCCQCKKLKRVRAIVINSKCGYFWLQRNYCLNCKILDPEKHKCTDFTGDHRYDCALDDDVWHW